MNINVIRLNSNIVDQAYFDQLNERLVEYAVVLKENVVDSPVTVCLIESGGVEGQFKNQVLNKLCEPIYLVATNRANSLAATLEIATYLKQRDIEHKVFVDNDTANLAEELVNQILVKIAADSVRGSRLGVIGAPSDWLIASDVEYFKVKKKFGIQLVDVSLRELMDIYERKDLPLVQPENLKELREKSKGNEKTLNDAIRLYSALKVLIQTYNLQGLTIRCFDVVKIKKVTACLALALLNDEGYPCGCEGDIPALLTMFMIKKLIGQETFMVNPSSVNLTDKTIMFSHCTVPLKLCTNYSFDTHYETDSSIGIHGDLEEKIVNITKLSPDLDHLNITIGRIVKNLSLPNHCRTQIEVKLHDKTIQDFLSLNQGNHVIISYDNHKKLLTQFFEEFTK